MPLHQLQAAFAAGSIFTQPLHTRAMSQISCCLKDIQQKRLLVAGSITQLCVQIQEGFAPHADIQEASISHLETAVHEKPGWHIATRCL